MASSRNPMFAKGPEETSPPVGRFSCKPEVETYVHRSGRTGRAGRKGVCVTLYGNRDRGALQMIEHATGSAVG